MISCRSIALAAILLLPATALAQPDPNEPTNPAGEPPQQPIPTPPPPPPAPPQQQPTVIVQTPAPQPTTVVMTEPSYEMVEDPLNARVFASGALTFVASYGASVITAASLSQEKRDRWADRLYVPVVGPWLALNDYGGNCPIAQPRCDDQTTTKVLLVADGVFQAAGVLTMLTGVMSPTYHRRVRGYADTSIRFRPTVVGGSGSGVVAFGSF